MSAGTPHTKAQHGFRPDIEGLRGIAILLVVAYHVGIPGISGGYIGVDVFFVLSGYLITGLLVNEAEATGHIDFFQFYARRGRRLLPAAVLVFVVTLLVGLIIFSPTELRDLTTSVSAASSYLSNVRFAFNATNYLADDARGDPVLHTWSLAVEEQFYLIWPFLIASLMQRRPNSTSSETDRRRRLIGVVALLSIISFGLCVWLTRFALAWAFFGSPTRVWEFGVGAVAVLTEQSLLRDQHTKARILAWGGLAAIVAAAVLFDTGTQFPGSAATLPVFGTAALLMSGTVLTQGWVEGLLRTRPLQWFGRLSYSWYLWHWPVLTFAWILYPSLGVSVRLAGAILALLFALASYTLIEQRVRYSRFFVPRPRVSVAAALGLTFASILFTLGMRGVAVHAAASPAQIMFTRARVDIPRVDKTKCSLDFFEVKQPGSCAFGDTTSDTTIVLFGDSHAGHWFPALERIALDRHWKLVALTKSACPTMSVRLAYAKLGREYTECAEWRTATLKRIVTLKPLLVVMSNSSYYVARDGTKPDQWEVSAATWQQGAEQSISQLNQAEISTLILHDVLRPNFDVPVCHARRAWSFIWRSNTCTFDRDSALNIAAVRAEQLAVAGFPRAVVFDVNSIICRTSPCATRLGQMVLYKDSNHMTGVYSASLAPILSQEIDHIIAVRRIVANQRDDHHAHAGPV